MKMGHFKNLSIKEILLKYRKIDPITGCWLWLRGTNRDGYGTIELNGKGYLVHRLSHEEFIGPLKNLACHKLECPNRKCFNPNHLYDGDKFDNNDDKIIMGNHPMASKTHCPQGHPYDDKNTRIQSGRRVCRICGSASGKKWREKKKLERQLKLEAKLALVK